MGMLRNKQMTRSNLSTVKLASILAASLLVLPACKPPAAPTDSQPKADAAATPSAPAEPVVAAAATPAAEAVTAPVSLDLTTSDAEAPALQPAAASAKPLDLPEIVATVNGEKITREQLKEIFNAAVEASGAKPQDLTQDQQLNGYNQLLQDLIMEKLVAKAAADEKVSAADVDAEIAKIKSQFPDAKVFEQQLKEAGQTPEKLNANIRSALQQQRWMKSQIKAPEVTEAQAKEFYASNTKEFEQPETVKASHILFMVEPDASPDVVKQKEADAQKAADRAAKGEDFTKLAKELSEEPGAAESGGDLGFFPKDRMVPEFAEVAFVQKVDSISKPVRTQFGWHVIKVTDKKAAGTVPFTEVKDQIIAYLKSTSQRDAVQDVLKKLKASAKIETFLPASS
jgi:peptidyl-prolyl cis-trans isomerase C